MIKLNSSTYTAILQVQYKQKEILGELGMNETDQIGSLITYTFNAANRGKCDKVLYSGRRKW